MQADDDAAAPVPWHAALPRLSADEVRAAATAAAVDSALASEVLAAYTHVLSRYCNVPEDAVELKVLEAREAGLDAPPPGATGTRLWASLAVEPDGSPLYVEMDAAFAAALADRVLGGNGVLPDSLRPLSPLEQPVIEFLWLSVLRELNTRLSAALFRLESVAAEPPRWLARAREEGEVPAGPPPAAGGPTPRGVLADTRLGVATTSGLARCGVTFEALAALDAARNPLRERASPLAARAPQLAAIVPEVALRLVLGETEVGAGELVRLEAGDVLLVEQWSARWQDGEFTGRLRLRVGDGPGPFIVGQRVKAREPRAGAREGATGGPKLGAAALKLFVEGIHGGGTAAATERLKMEEEQISEAMPAEGTSALDELMLTVHVELAARLIGIEELSVLRVGHVLELDCSATDPVELTVGGRRLARGELVDIEGRLGVRITQLGH
jgi:type III secretion system YscQ/HrcQ family protein